MSFASLTSHLQHLQHTVSPNHAEANKLLRKAMAAGEGGVVNAMLEWGTPMTPEALEEAAREGHREIVQATLHLVDDQGRQNAIRWAALNQHREVCNDLLVSLTTPLSMHALQWGARSKQLDIVQNMLPHVVWGAKMTEGEKDLLKSVCDSTPDIYDLFEQRMTPGILEYGFTVATRQCNEDMFHHLLPKVQHLVSNEDWGRLFSHCISKRSAPLPLVDQLAQLCGTSHWGKGWEGALSSGREDFLDFMMDKCPHHIKKVLERCIEQRNNKNFEYVWTKQKGNFSGDQLLSLLNTALIEGKDETIMPIFQHIDWSKYSEAVLNKKFPEHDRHPYIQRLMMERAMEGQAGGNTPNKPRKI